jgi:hypothetical protein
VEKMSRREGVGRGKNGRQERLRERGSAIILNPWPGVYGALAGRVSLDGIVR